jgi:hypothetical protein
VGTGAPIGGGNTALATGKGFDQDQIAKLKDVCGVRLGAYIPAIWAVIQSSKGKSYDSYRAHISNAMETWARTNHIKTSLGAHFQPNIFVPSITEPTACAVEGMIPNQAHLSSPMVWG